MTLKSKKRRKQRTVNNEPKSLQSWLSTWAQSGTETLPPAEEFDLLAFMRFILAAKDAPCPQNGRSFWENYILQRFPESHRHQAINFFGICWAEFQRDRRKWMHGQAIGDITGDRLAILEATQQERI